MDFIGFYQVMGKTTEMSSGVPPVQPPKLTYWKSMTYNSLIINPLHNSLIVKQELLKKVQKYLASSEKPPIFIM